MSLVSTGVRRTQICSSVLARYDHPQILHTSWNVESFCTHLFDLQLADTPPAASHIPDRGRPPMRCSQAGLGQTTCDPPTCSHACPAQWLPTLSCSNCQYPQQNESATLLAHGPTYHFSVMADQATGQPVQTRTLSCGLVVTQCVRNGSCNVLLHDLDCMDEVSRRCVGWTQA